MFKQIPEEIYPILQAYLTHDDYHCLVNTSKLDFYEIKRNTIYLKLLPKYSMMFLTNEKNFQLQIHGLVADPTKQICIHIELLEETLLTSLVNLRVHRLIIGESNLPFFPFLPFIKEINIIELTSKSINDLSNLHHLQSVTISCLGERPFITDISPLRDIPEISFENFSNLKDFQILGKQRKLIIYCCQNLINVSNFSKINELSIRNCPLLRDISPLRNIPILSIGHCKLIRDLTPLSGNHQSLTIDNCNYELEGYEILRNIPIVHLLNCNIRDVSVLREAKLVSLSHCQELVDVSPLFEVKNIHLYGCRKIVDISAISNVPKLVIANLPAVQNAHLLKNPDLTVFAHVATSNLLVASTARSLGLSSTAVRNLGNVSSYRNLQYLLIEYVTVDFSTQGLADILVIELKYCDRLSDIIGLGRNRDVRLIGCPLIRDVSSLRNVPLVTISQCPGISDYSCLKDVPRLKLY